MDLEAIFAIPSPDRGRDFILPLSRGGVQVRTVVQSGNQLVQEIAREPVDCILLPETLPDGPAEMWLKKVAAVGARRPLAVVLIYGVEASEAIREKILAAYGEGAEVVAAGSRAIHDVAAETTRVLDSLARRRGEQERDAYDRLNRDVEPGQVPQPVRRGGAVAFAGVSGGVGTSTLVTNLALCVAMAGQRVLVVDAQFGSGGSILHYFGQQQDEQSHGMHHLRWTYLSSNNTVRENAADELMKRLEEVRLKNVRHAEIRVLSVPAILESMSNLPGEQVSWAIQVLERNFDLVLVDCGSGVGHPRTQHLLESANRIYLMAGGWGASVHALVRSLTAMEGRPVMDRFFLLLREAEGAYGSRTVRSVAQVPIFGRVPDDPAVRKSETRLGASIPVVADQPASPYAESVNQLAFSLGFIEQQLAGKAVDARSKGWFRFGVGKG